MIFYVDDIKCAARLDEPYLDVAYKGARGLFNSETVLEVFGRSWRFKEEEESEHIPGVRKVRFYEVVSSSS